MPAAKRSRPAPRRSSRSPIRNSRPGPYAGFSDPIAGRLVANALGGLVGNATTISRGNSLSDLGDPRRSVEDECGYPPLDSTISIELFRRLYDRCDVANRAVQLMPKECWKAPPEVYETEDSEDVTAFEEDWDNLGNSLQMGPSLLDASQGNRVWEYLSRADTLSRLGSFGIILIGLDDGKNLQEPVDGLVTINWKQSPVSAPVWNSRKKVHEIKTVGIRRHSPTYAPPLPDSPPRTFEINALRAAAGRKVWDRYDPRTKQHVYKIEQPPTLNEEEALIVNSWQEEVKAGQQVKQLIQNNRVAHAVRYVDALEARGIPWSKLGLTTNERTRLATAKHQLVLNALPRPGQPQQPGFPPRPQQAPLQPNNAFPPEPQPVLKPEENPAGAPTPPQQAASRLIAPTPSAAPVPVQPHPTTAQPPAPVDPNAPQPDPRLAKPAPAPGPAQPADPNAPQVGPDGKKLAPPIAPRTAPPPSKVAAPAAPVMPSAAQKTPAPAPGQPAPASASAPNPNGPQPDPRLQPPAPGAAPTPAATPASPPRPGQLLPPSQGTAPAGSSNAPGAPRPAAPGTPPQPGAPQAAPIPGQRGAAPAQLPAKPGQATETDGTEEQPPAGSGPAGGNPQRPGDRFSPPPSGQPTATDAPDRSPKQVFGTDKQYGTSDGAMSSGYGMEGAQYGSMGMGTDQQYYGGQLGPSEYPAMSPSPAKPHKITFLRVYDESLVQVVRYEWNVNNPRFGMPVMYRVTLNDPREIHGGIGLPLATVFVHWSRVVHLCDVHANAGSSEIFAPPVLRPILHRVMDLYKLPAAAAEGYWQSGTPTKAFETHPQMGGDVLVDKNEIRDDVEYAVNSLIKVLFGRGGSWKLLAPSMVDPSPFIQTQIELICIQLGCPVRIFKGSERGELASSQDDSNWNDRVTGRQNGYLTPRLIGPFVDRLIGLGVLRAPATYSVKWPDLESLSKKDKAQIALTLTQADSAYIQGGVEQLFPPADYMVETRGMTKEKAAQILGNAQAHAEETMAQQQLAAEQQMGLQQTQMQTVDQGLDMASQIAAKHGFKIAPPEGFVDPKTQAMEHKIALEGAKNPGGPAGGLHAAAGGGMPGGIGHPGGGSPFGGPPKAGGAGGPGAPGAGAGGGTSPFGAKPGAGASPFGGGGKAGGPIGAGGKAGPPKPGAGAAGKGGLPMAAMPAMSGVPASIAPPDTKAGLASAKGAAKAPAKANLPPG